MTDYFKILNEMEIILKENAELKSRLAKNMSKITPSEKPFMSEHKILTLLLDCAKKNSGKKPGAWRFDEIMKELAFMVFSLGGLALYEILCFNKNLPFPSVMTVRRKIYSNEKFAEGVFRIKKLKDFLVLHNCPFSVHLSEDATAVTGRIQYDSARNQIVGFTLPYDSNGLPIFNSYPATSAAVIAEYFKQKSTSRYAYCIMAAPLKEGAPSFCLVFYGTDNRFTADDVKSRLAWTKGALEKEGIKVVSIASDGDTRLLSTMCQNVVTSAPPDWPWFSAKKKVQEVYIQDHIHIGTKLKSRLLKPSVILPVGEHIVSRGHLVELINTVSKDQHELTENDINPKDKMNYRALQKVTDEKVTNLLRCKVANSEGTATYLDMTREILHSYTKPDLTPLVRIKMIWKWNFFLRIWRTSIEESGGDYTVTNNFISSNSYACVEINSHCLIQVIIMLRDREEHSFFLPWKLSSQDCEKIFRILRSAVAAHCGVTAFSILDLENHFRRLDLLSSTYVKLAEVLSFPRHHKAAAVSQDPPHIPVSLPEDFEIKAAVCEGLQEALALAKKFKMVHRKSISIPKCHLKVKTQQLEVELDDNFEDEIDSEFIDIAVDGDDEFAGEVEAEIADRSNQVIEDLFMVSSGALGVKKYNNVPLSASSPFVLVSDGFKIPAIIRKSTFCWLLSSGETRLSSDRLARVMAAPVNHSLSLPTLIQTVKLPSVEENVHIGDWCAFSENNSVAIGRILAFSYLTGTSLKNQEYSKLSAPVKAPDKNARGLGCLCSWFSLKGNSAILHETSMDIHGYYTIETYICSLPRPTYQEGRLKLSCNLRDILKVKQ